MDYPQVIKSKIMAKEYEARLVAMTRWYLNDMNMANAESF